MKKILLAVCAFLIIIHAYADNPKIDLEAFAQKHFEKMIATQAPDATKEDLESYLGAHTEYSAELLEVFIFNDSAIALRYKDHAKGIHPQNKQKKRIWSNYDGNFRNGAWQGRGNPKVSRVEPT